MMEESENKYNNNRGDDNQMKKQDFSKKLSGRVSEEVTDKIGRLKEENHGNKPNTPPPSKSEVAYPEEYDAVDRIMHVLKIQRRCERQCDWIATAADVNPEVCEIILESLSTGGMVITPTENGASGYRLSPYWQVINDMKYEIEQLPDWTSNEPDRPVD